MKPTMLAGLVAVAVMWVAGCGGKAEPESPAPPKPAAEKIRDACDLLTTEEVAAVHGSAVTVTRENHGAAWSSCEFLDPAKSNYFVMGIEVYWTGGRQEWRTTRGATSGAARMLEHDAPGTDVKGIIDQNPASGLGDRANFSDIMGGHVLKGDTMIDFKFGILKDPRRHFRPLAEKVLSRL